jgi:hypothetical protein
VLYWIQQVESTQITASTALESPPSSGNAQKALADKVAAQTARGSVIARAAVHNVDGSLHPNISSTKKKIAATRWERSWLMNYFMNLPPDFTGNYYRYMSVAII